MGVVVNCFYRGRTSVVYVNVSCDACGAADGSALGKLLLGAAKGVRSGSPPGTGGGSQTPY